MTVWPIIAALVVAGLAAAGQFDRDKKKQSGGKTLDQIKAEGIAEGRKQAETEAAQRAADEKRIRRVAQRELERTQRSRFSRSRFEDDDDPPPPSQKPAEGAKA